MPTAAVLAFILLLSLPAGIIAAETEDNLWAGVSFTLDNDLLARDNTDRHYTNGTFVTLDSKRLTSFDADNTPALLWPIVKLFPRIREAGDYSSLSYEFGQGIFTPDDITQTVRQPDDLPYAGLLYGAASFTTNHGRFADRLTLAGGIVGPWSLAEQTQKLVHKIIDVDDPKGWDYQLKNEPVFNLMYVRRQHLHGAQLTRNIDYRWVSGIKGSIGNMLTEGEVGITLMLTPHSGNRLGALSGSSTQRAYLFKGDLPRGFFAYIGLTGRATLHNIFLDGNSFRNGPSVDKEYLSGSLHYGLGYRFKHWILGLSWTRETRRFKTQTHGLHYGSMSISYGF